MLLRRRGHQDLPSSCRRHHGMLLCRVVCIDNTPLSNTVAMQHSHSYTSFARSLTHHSLARSFTNVLMQMHVHRWKNDSRCYKCGAVFTWAFGSTPRHHCRQCGNSVCHEHSQNTLLLPHFGDEYAGPERVCDTCYTTVRTIPCMLMRVAFCLPHFSLLVAA